jgi:cellulose synthase/poly-beta-1,6-N-acetylglucosamine synthase-like glycosyltransferase
VAALIVFWAATGLIFVAYFGYPMLLVVLGKLLNRPIRRDESFEPRVTLVIPCYNEEEILEAKLANTMALDYPRDKLEVFVASDHSTDRTDEIAKSWADRNVKYFRPKQRCGKPALIYACSQQATGDFIMLTDANTMWRPDVVRRFVRNFADERIGACDGVRRETDEQGETCESTYWRYEMFVKRMASRLHAVLGGTGAIMMVRKEALDPISPRRSDDFELAVRARLHGWGVVFDEEAVAIEPSPNNLDQIKRVVRMVSWNHGSAYILLKESILRFRPFVGLQIVCHKFLRWNVPLFAVAAFAANAFLLRAGLWYQIVFGLQCLFYALAVGGWLRDRAQESVPKLLSIPYYFSLMNYASLVGLLRFYIRNPVETWERRKGDQPQT